MPFRKSITEPSPDCFDRLQYKVGKEELYRQHGEINAQYEAVLDELKQRKSNVAAGEEFLRYFTEMSGPIKKFNEMYWDRLLGKMIVAEGKKLTVVFVGGYRVINQYMNKRGKSTCDDTHGCIFTGEKK